MRTRYDRLQLFFQTHGSKAVFMARFITGVRFMAGPMAGACGMPFFQFLGWNVLGAIVWCSLVVTVGYLVGDELYPRIDDGSSGVAMDWAWPGLLCAGRGLRLLVEGPPSCGVAASIVAAFATASR